MSKNKIFYYAIYCLFTLVPFCSLKASSNVVDVLSTRLLALTNEIRTLSPALKVVGTNDSVIFQHGKTKRNEGIAKDRKGNELKKARKIVFDGPESDGFVLKVRWRVGSYQETAARGFSLTFDKSKARKAADYYSSTALKVFPDNSAYAVVDLDFGENADTKLAQKIYNLIKREMDKPLK